MIHTVEDFFNKARTDIKQKYFPEVIHGVSENESYYSAIHALELFNNGCITYRTLIRKLCKFCKDSSKNIHAIIENHIRSFGEYRFTPSKA